MALSQAPPALAINKAISTHTSSPPANIPPNASAPIPKPTKGGAETAIIPGKSIFFNAAAVAISTHLAVSGSAFPSMEGNAEPDTAKCVDIATAAALKKMLLPGIIAVSAPPLVGLGIGAEALGGMLAGGLLVCVLMALFMANAGGAWDNAKKYIEKGNLGGKGTDTHAAAVVGDTVGDPFKDTSGPSMNILINVMAIVSLVIAPLL